MKDEKCSNCKYHIKDNPNYGECHRYPPKKLIPDDWPEGGEPQQSDENRWPIVFHDEWCGEYRKSSGANVRLKSI